MTIKFPADGQKGFGLRAKVRADVVSAFEKDAPALDFVLAQIDALPVESEMIVVEATSHNKPNEKKTKGHFNVQVVIETL